MVEMTLLTCSFLGNKLRTMNTRRYVGVLGAVAIPRSDLHQITSSLQNTPAGAGYSQFGIHPDLPLPKNTI